MGGQNISAMAEQLGMTVEDLQKELQSGKNMRDLATEKGVELLFGGRMRGGSGAVLTSSGSSAGPRQ